jgi:hypothetical protein
VNERPSYAKQPEGNVILYHTGKCWVFTKREWFMSSDDHHRALAVCSAWNFAPTELSDQTWFVGNSKTTKYGRGKINFTTRKIHEIDETEEIDNAFFDVGTLFKTIRNQVELNTPRLYAGGIVE